MLLLALAGVGIWYWTSRVGDTVAGPGPGKGRQAATGVGAAAGGGRRGADPRTVMPVAVQPARTMDFVVYQNALGNVAAASTVTVRPRVDGQLARVLFREGDIVKAGSVLAEIDPRPFEVQVMQASGQMARDQAGATYVIDYEQQNVQEALRDLTAGRGPDACIDCVGLEAHGHGLQYAHDSVKQKLHVQLDRPLAVREAIMACRSAGIISILGVYVGLMDKFPIGTVMNRGLTIKTGRWVSRSRIMPQ